MRTFILAILLPIVGCSSAPKTVSERSQYCHTYQTIETENREQVNSKVRVECTDDQLERITAKRLGVAPECGEYKYFMTLNNRLVERRGYACKKYDGNWEIVPHPSMFQ